MVGNTFQYTALGRMDKGCSRPFTLFFRLSGGEGPRVTFHSGYELIPCLSIAEEFPRLWGQSASPTHLYKQLLFIQLLVLSSASLFGEAGGDTPPVDESMTQALVWAWANQSLGPGNIYPND